MLGLPTLLLRRATERSDGLGDGIELSHLQPQLIRDFIAKHAERVWPIKALTGPSPSQLVVDIMQESFS